MLTLHVAGGEKMLAAAVETVKHFSNISGFKKPLLLGVTILTSLSGENMKKLGHKDDISEYVKSYTKVAYDVGLDGIVCSPLEIETIKKLYGHQLKIITPGIRIKKENNDDQNRVLTPNEAFDKGSDYIVMGRPLIKSKNPNHIIKKIINFKPNAENV